MNVCAQHKNRYANAPKNADHTIDQRWDTYTAAEHDRWDRLFQRQLQILPRRAAGEFLDALGLLKLSESGIPDMARLSERLHALTGWRVVPVADLVPDAVFFEHLANRRFPAGAFIRPESEFDYLQEPDVFHDIFGHVPLLANPTFAAFMEAYGKGGRRALERGQLHHLARLYWYTVEFGLLDTPAGLRIYGAGILSSPRESVFCLEDPSPHRVRFSLQRIMRTRYVIDDFQQIYFVIDSFQRLLDDCYQDFGGLYDRLRSLPDLEAYHLTPEDELIQRGTRAYFLAKNGVRGVSVV